MKRNIMLILIFAGGLFVSYAAASASEAQDSIPLEVLNQPGQGELSDPNAVLITGVSPEHAAYLYPRQIEQSLELAAAAEVDGDSDASIAYREKAAEERAELEQLCKQLAADGVRAEDC